MNTANERPSTRRFSIAHLAIFIPWVALVIDAWSPIRDNSFLWHIRAGTLQANLSTVITEDPFSFTVGGERWLTQSWLAELLYAWGEGLTGLGFVPWMLLITTSLIFLGIGLIAYRGSLSIPATAFVLILSTLLLISFLVPRPVLFSYLLFVLVVLAWDRIQLRWVVPFLFWIWASVHGSFVIGLAYVGLSLIMRKEWKQLHFAVVAALPTLLTAHGTGVLEILMDFTRAQDTLSLLSEWRRPTIASPVFVAFLGGVAFIVIGAYRKLITPTHLLMLVPFLALGFSSLRAVPPAWFGILPLVSLALSDIRIGSRERFGTVSFAAFLVAVVALPLFLVKSASIDADRFPVEASKHLAPLRTFHDDRVGGYLIWDQWPEQLVYLDDRAELYLDRMQEFVDVRSGEIPWQPVFSRDRIDQVLLRNEEGLLDALKKDGWSVFYEDEWYTVLRS